MAKKDQWTKKKKTGCKKGIFCLKKTKETDTSINYRLLSFTEVPFYAFISYQ